MCCFPLPFKPHRSAVLKSKKTKQLLSVEMRRSRGSTNSTGPSARKWGNKSSAEDYLSQFPGLCRSFTGECLGLLGYKMQLILALFCLTETRTLITDRLSEQSEPWLKVPKQQVAIYCLLYDRHLTQVISFNLYPTQRGWYNYYLHFREEESES